MFRYLALIWDASQRRQSDTALMLEQRLTASSSWSRALCADGLSVFCTNEGTSLRARVLSRNRGVVLGTVFLRNADPEDDTPCQELIPNEHCSDAIVASRGEWLASHCWGNYVALCMDRQGERSWVCKDPTGSLPCFHLTFEGVTLIFSAITDCLDLGVGPFTVSWRYLGTRMCTGAMTQPGGALNEISQVHRGECVEIDPRCQPALVARRFHWQPTRFQRCEELIDDAGRAARALRSTLRSCVASLVGRHESSLLRLSGGLDSSIVLGCLKSVAPSVRLLAVTQYCDERAGDPRPWARMAACDAQCEHLEYNIAPQDIRLQAILDMVPSVEPYSTLMHLVTWAPESELSLQRHVTAVFTGDGGDCIFGSMCMPEVLVSYLRRHGLDAGALRLAEQNALAMRQTTWAVLSRGLRAWLIGDRKRLMSDHGREARRLVPEDVVRRSIGAREPHPWFGAVERPSWEMLNKLGALLITPNCYESAPHPAAAAPELIAPIYAQPVVELSLRIPAHVLFADGRDRGLARRAFRGDVPQPILDRLWKDRAGDFHNQLLHRHLDWLRETFLDGVLVREGLLDGAAVERALSGALGRAAVYPAEIFQHLDVELWARHWAARSDGLRSVA